MANSQVYLNAYRITDPTSGTFSISVAKGGGGLNGAQTNNVTLSDGTSTGSTQTGENFNILGDVANDAVNNGSNNSTSTYIGIGVINGVQGVIVNDPNGQGGGGYFFLTGVNLAVGTSGTSTLASAANSSTWWSLGGTATPTAPSGIAATDNVGAIQGTFASGVRTDDATPSLTGTADAGAQVKIYLNGNATPVATVFASATGQWTWTPATALAQGTYSYTATQTNTAGTTSVASSAFVVTIDTAAPSAPTVALSSDTGRSGADTITSAKALSGTAEANSTVTIKEGTTTLGTVTADGTGAWSFANASASNGSHTYTVTATDIAGNTSAAASLSVTIDTAAPSAPAGLVALDNVGALQDPLGSGGRTDDATPTLTGTAENGATISIYLDGGTNPVAITTADASGNWSYTPPAALAEGSHSFTATATDAAGNISGVSTTFTVTVDTTLCYLEGTHILTPTGEVPIQYLKIGDMVVTRWAGIQPIKWVGRQSFSAQFVKANRAQIPVRIKAGALGERQPARSLSVSPGHSMLVGGSLVLARSLVNGVTITQDEPSGTVNYFQIELEAHDCVIAEGSWSETYADCVGLRDQFHNAAEFEELYPDHRPPEELRLCAPRPECGAKLDEVLRPVVARASAGMKWGRLRGSIDRIAGPWKIEGWAQDPDHPELPVLLEVLLEDQVIGTVLACDFRKDLLDAGIGQGRCSFVFSSPMKIRPELAGTLHIRRAADGAEIQMSADCKARIEQEPVHRVGQMLRLVS